MSRVVTLVVAVGFAVVGRRGCRERPPQHDHGHVRLCVDAGGWTVTWTVVNSENVSETITASNRTPAVPVEHDG